MFRQTCWWAGGTAVLVLLNLAFWPSVEGTDALAELEETSAEILEAFGAANIGTPSGYLDGQIYALFLPLLLSAMVIASVTALTAGDEENGRLELLQALPVSRQQLWLARLGASLVALVLVVAILTVMVTATLPLFSLEGAGAVSVAVATLACGLLAAFHAAAAYAVAAWRGSRGLAVGLSVVLLAAGYVLDFIFPLVPALEPLQVASPWYWGIGQQPVSDGVEPAWIALLCAATAGLAALGTFAIGRRDVRSA